MVRTLTKLAGQAALAVGLAVGAGSAGAVLIDFDKGCALGNRPTCTQNTSYASPHVFASIGSPSFNLTVFGFTPANAASDLFSKFTLGDPGETGLGFLNDPLGDHEIAPGWYIDDVLPVIPGGTNIYHLVVSSVQNGESFNIYRNSAGQGAVSLTGLLFGGVTNTCAGGTVAGLNACAFDINTAGFTQLVLQGVTGNVLQSVFTTNTVVVPEPATVALLGLGLFAAGLARRRKL